MVGYSLMEHTKPLPPLDRLRELFWYCPVSGFLYNKQRGLGYAASRNQRYRTCWVDGEHYYQHRVVWKLMTGEDPPDELDHKDRNGFNNKWLNLRLTDRSGNCVNTSLRKDNALKERCIHYCNMRGKYVVQVQRNKKRLQKLFASLQEAITFRDEVTS